MKTKIFIFLIFVATIVSLACVPASLPKGEQTATPGYSTSTYAPTNTKAPTVTIAPTSTKVDKPTPTRVVPTVPPTSTNTAVVLTATSIVTITPEVTSTNTPFSTNTPTKANTSTPTAIFTITRRATNPPREQPNDTPTPTPFIQYTYFYTQTPLPFCKDDPTCNVHLDTDTLLDKDLLRIRFWNWGLYASTLTTTVKVGEAYTMLKGIGVDSETTGELVFNIPCIKDAKEITITIKFPGYTAVETIEYPTCICQE